MYENISKYADLLTLLYHEGRNVRHLIKNGHQVDPRFLSLRNGLATNRVEAWKQIQPLRKKANEALSASAAERIFERKLGLKLDDLEGLYELLGWIGTPYGGNAWLPIVRMVKELRKLIDSGRWEEAHSLEDLILESHHNTGKVSDKLKNLDTAIR
jgi:hypothetical protein